jgi:hypothetical protein
MIVKSLCPKINFEEKSNNNFQTQNGMCSTKIANLHEDWTTGKGVTHSINFDSVSIFFSSFFSLVHSHTHSLMRSIFNMQKMLCMIFE